MPIPSDSSRHLFVEEHNDVVINQILGLSEQSSEQDTSQQDAEGQTQEQIINGQQVCVGIQRKVSDNVNYFHIMDIQTRISQNLFYYGRKNNLPSSHPWNCFVLSSEL